jgi:aminoglycoside phosphotransferase family enzyme/predicted kinase
VIVEERCVTSETLPAHIAALLDPAAYPDPVESVELVQTHISYVLLTDDKVYKLKKPVDLGFLNFTTLRRRHYYCRQEVALNRRLCDGTYLGVVRVTEQDGRYQIGGSGTVVDYAVEMRRLPAGRMMDQLLEAGQLEPAMVDRLAGKIATFHNASATGREIERFGSPRVIERNWRENFEQTQPFIGRTLTAWQAALLEVSISAFIVRNQSLFRERIAAGRIRDCHGDLRASAVCFTDDICVYDCIEFNRRFRYSDVASEVSFLAMDLDRRGRPDLADRFVASYQAESGDDGTGRVLNFYKCYRAYVRGKVNSFQLDVPEIPAAAKLTAQASAQHYFELACRYAAIDRPPLLIVMAGLSGTGKSAVANGLATGHGLHVIASDAVRKNLAGVPAGEHRYGAYEGGIYSTEFSERTYDAIRDRARRLLIDGQSVVLDATFQQREERERAMALATEAGALTFCVETAAGASVVRERLAAREQDATTLSDARWETYLQQVEHFEPVTELDDWQHIRVDAEQPLDDVVAGAVSALTARLLPAPLDAGSN